MQRRLCRTLAAHHQINALVCIRLQDGDPKIGISVGSVDIDRGFKLCHRLSRLREIAAHGVGADGLKQLGNQFLIHFLFPLGQPSCRVYLQWEYTSTQSLQSATVRISLACVRDLRRLGALRSFTAVSRNIVLAVGLTV